MPKAAIFDVDGTLIDSVDLHAKAWHEAFEKFGHKVSFQEARSQIGKGGDKLLPVFLTHGDLLDHGEELVEWRGKHFMQHYLPMVRPFSAVPELMQRVHAAGLKIAIASSATRSELDAYLDIACITSFIDVATSGEDAEQSKPAPDIFQIALRKLGIGASASLAIGDTPYDAEAAGRAGINTIGFLSGGFPESDLIQAGCIATYPGPSALLACFSESPLSPAGGR